MNGMTNDEFSGPHPVTQDMNPVLSNRLIKRKPWFFEFAVLGTLLVLGKLIFDFASAEHYVYPQSDYGQKNAALVLIGLAIICCLIIAAARFLQKRVILGISLVGLCFIPAFLPRIFDGPDWKFRANKLYYLSAIRADQTKPRYHVFDWGNRNSSLGGGVVYEALVFDEEDAIATDPALRPADWKGNAGLALPEYRWITAIPPDCRRFTRAMGDHFYYVTQACQ